jgi:hypothetical protein
MTDVSDWHKAHRVKELKQALEALLPAAHRAQRLCSSGETYNFCNDWDERDAAEYQEAIALAERALEGVASE